MKIFEKNKEITVRRVHTLDETILIVYFEDISSTNNWINYETWISAKNMCVFVEMEMLSVKLIYTYVIYPIRIQ